MSLPIAFLIFVITVEVISVICILRITRIFASIENDYSESEFKQDKNFYNE